MQAMFDLPDRVIRELETLAIEEGTTPGQLIQDLVTEHLKQHGRLRTKEQEVRLPLIPIAETGPIRTLRGSDLDEILAREDLAS